MSGRISREQTPTGAFRRPLFNPCFPADITDEYITFEDPHLASSAVTEPPVVSTSPHGLARWIVLAMVTSGGAMVTASVLGLLLAGLYTFSSSVDDLQMTGAAGESVDVIRD